VNLKIRAREARDGLDSDSDDDDGSLMDDSDDCFDSNYSMDLFATVSLNKNLLD
jgi:hypothetical protein